MRKTLATGVAMIGGMLAWVPPAAAQQQPQNQTAPTPVPNLGQPSGPATVTPGQFYWANPPLSTATPKQSLLSTQVGPTPPLTTVGPDWPTPPEFRTYDNRPPLSPGDVTVRLQGKLTFDAGVASDTGQNAGKVTLAPGGAPVATNNKLASYTFMEYARLLPSFDGVAANGIKYGAFLEIRADSPGAPGAGANGSFSDAIAARGKLYYYRETGYIGTADFGFVRYGVTDGPMSLFTTGTNEAFNSGGWNGDKVGFTSNTIPIWPFADYITEINTSKVVYVSPRYADTFDFGVSFEPNTGGGGPGPGNCPYAITATGTASTALGCDTTSSTSIAAETLRRRNTIEAVLRGIGTLGAVGLAGTIGFATSGNVQYNGTGTVARYNGLGLLDSGVQLTYGGWQTGAHILAGHANGAWGTLQPKGGRDAMNWVAGASYAFGSVSVGVQYVNFQNSGAWTPLVTNVGRTRSESGVGAGGTLTLAPNTFLILNYLYGLRHQSGVDLLTGVTNARTNNSTFGQGVGLSLSVRW
jgi:hypothetical protein